MKKKILSMIIVIIMATSLAITVSADENFTGDTTKNWQYIVPFCKYDYCEILSNGLIKIGKIIDWKFSDVYESPPEPVMVYGLLDNSGKPLADMIYDYIGSPNADGYMLATINNDNRKTKYVLFDNLGNILSTPEDANILLFLHSYSVETSDSFTFYVNNESHKVLKSVMEKAGVCLENENEYMIHKVSAVYSNCFVMRRDSVNDKSVFVFNWDSTV